MPWKKRRKTHHNFNNTLISGTKKHRRSFVTSLPKNKKRKCRHDQQKAPKIQTKQKLPTKKTRNSKQQKSPPEKANTRANKNKNKPNKAENKQTKAESKKRTTKNAKKLNKNTNTKRKAKLK